MRAGRLRTLRPKRMRPARICRRVRCRAKFPCGHYTEAFQGTQVCTASLCEPLAAPRSATPGDARPMALTVPRFLAASGHPAHPKAFWRLRASDGNAAAGCWLRQHSRQITRPVKKPPHLNNIVDHHIKDHVASNFKPVVRNRTLLGPFIHRRSTGHRQVVEHSCLNLIEQTFRSVRIAQIFGNIRDGRVEIAPEKRQIARTTTLLGLAHSAALSVSSQTPRHAYSARSWWPLACPPRRAPDQPCR